MYARDCGDSLFGLGSSDDCLGTGGEEGRFGLKGECVPYQQQQLQVSNIQIWSGRGKGEQKSVSGRGTSDTQSHLHLVPLLNKRFPPKSAEI